MGKHKIGTLEKRAMTVDLLCAGFFNDHLWNLLYEDKCLLGSLCVWNDMNYEFCMEYTLLERQQSCFALYHCQDEDHKS